MIVRRKPDTKHTTRVFVNDYTGGSKTSYLYYTDVGSKYAAADELKKMGYTCLDIHHMHIDFI